MQKSLTKRIILLLIALFVFSVNVLSQQKAIPHERQTKHRKTFEKTLLNHSAEKAREIKSEEVYDEHNTRKKISDNDLYSYNRNERNKSYEKYSENYFKIDRSENSLWNGKHWLEKDFPLKVYVKKSSSKFYKTKFSKYIDYAFKVWSNADSRISFQYVNSSSNADIVVTFVENLMEKYVENYLGLTDYELGRNKKIEVSTVEISMLKFSDEIVSNGEIKSTIVHEFGHALGLGHSDNDIDIMYPYINPESSEEMKYDDLSIGDIDAVKSVIDLGSTNRYTRR